MGKYIETLGQQLGTGVASNIIGTGMGLLLEGHNDRRQRQQQQRMNEIENTRAKEMVDYNFAKQLEMWKATSYGAQKAEMKKAGLNPALMYGMSGGGGITTGSAQPGSAGADAPKGGREVLDAMGISMEAAQLSLLKAQKENIEADTANKQGDAANKPIIGKNIAADTENKITQNFIMEIERDIKGATSNAAKAIVMHQLRITFEEMEMKVKEGLMKQKQMDAELTLQKAQAAKIYIDNELTKAQTTLSGTENEKKKQEIEEIKTEIRKMTDPQGIENYFERERIRLTDKGINVAIIAGTLGTILNFAGNFTPKKR